MAFTVGPHHDLLTEKFAIDCEFMRSNHGQLLGRVSIVNYYGKTVYDTFVCYPEPIIVTKTDEEFSGIRPEDVTPKNAQPFKEVQNSLLDLLRGGIVVGHDIEKDIGAISMNLDGKIGTPEVRMRAMAIQFDLRRRDTQKFSGFRRYANPNSRHGPTLKVLASAVLGRSIKQGRVSSVEDAVATMEIYRKFEDGIEEEQGEARL